MKKEGLKDYDTVAERIIIFKRDYPNHSIITELLSHTLTPEKKYQADFMCRIINQDGLTVATGHASEREGFGTINGTSWLENSETSSIGRALKSLGVSNTNNFASEEEVINAKSKKKVVEKKEIIEKGANTVAKAKKGVKSINLDFITDDRSVDGLKKMSESLKKMGVTRITLVGKLKNYDPEGKYPDLADFMTNCATSELKEFITKQVLGK
tara:strand:+ start:1126 stop:1761 length:636 start_codon:yes stop_codon:yes gene_type:complete